MLKHPSKPVYSEKTPKNRFEDMELPAGGSYSMSNFLESIRKGVESTSKPQKSHIA